MGRRERLQLTPANSRLKIPISLFPSPLTLPFGCPRGPRPLCVWPLLPFPSTTQRQPQACRAPSLENRALGQQGLPQLAARDSLHPFSLEHTSSSLTSSTSCQSNNSLHQSSSLSSGSSVSHKQITQFPIVQKW